MASQHEDQPQEMVGIDKGGDKSAVLSSEPQIPETIVPIKRGPGRPRKYPLSASSASSSSSPITAPIGIPTMTGNSMRSPAFQQTHEFYELQKLLLKEKMKKYAKKYIDKERRRLTQDYYPPPAMNRHYQESQVYDEGEEEEEDDDDDENDQETTDVEENYYGDTDTRRGGAGGVGGHSINNTPSRRFVRPSITTAIHNQQDQDPRYQAKLSQILGRRK